MLYVIDNYFFSVMLKDPKQLELINLVLTNFYINIHRREREVK